MAILSLETVKGRSGGVLRIRGASPSHHEIRDTWTEQRGKFHRDSQSAVVLLPRRSRTHYTVPPSVRVLTSRTRAPTGRRKERIPSAFQSIRLCPSVPPFGRPRPRIPSFERTVRPFAVLACAREGSVWNAARTSALQSPDRQPVCQPRECCSGELRRLGPLNGDRRTCTRKLFRELWLTEPI